MDLAAWTCDIKAIGEFFLAEGTETQVKSNFEERSVVRITFGCFDRSFLKSKPFVVFVDPLDSSKCIQITRVCFL